MYSHGCGLPSLQVTQEKNGPENLKLPQSLNQQCHRHESSNHQEK